MTQNTTERTYYDYNGSQQTTLLQMKYSFHKEIGQIAFTILVNQNLDFDLLAKAVNIEIARNDSLRLRHTVVDKRPVQYFIPEYRADKIPQADFTGKTREEQTACLTRQARIPLKVRKDEVFRILFFRACDGRTGIFFCVFHANMDVSAVMLFYADLLDVYVALKSGADLPKPLLPFEKHLQRDLAYIHNKNRSERDKAFFQELFAKDGPTTYCAPYGGERLMKLRARKKNPNIRYLRENILFHSRSENLRLQTGPERAARMLRFCEENNMPLQNFIYFALRVYICKINYNLPDAYFLVLFNRRITLADKRTGGCLVHSIPVRTILDEKATFRQTIGQINELFMQVIRHSDLSSMEVLNILDTLDQKSPLDSSGAMLLTTLPFQFAPPEEGWECELGNISNGHFAMPLYAFVLTDLSGKDISFHFEHNLKLMDEQKVRRMFAGALKVLDAVIANPDITVGELLGDVLKEYAPMPLEQLAGQKALNA